MSDWTLRPGDLIKRSELHLQFGGSGRNGISPSTRSPNVFIFSDPASGTQHGYYDQLKDDGCFHYTGEGQRGDQRMMGGNRAILEAIQTGRALRVFKGSGGVVQYEGEFVLDTLRPWYYTDAPETGGGPIRTVIVFRLRPLVAVHQIASATTDELPRTSVENVPVEERNTERMVVDPNRTPYAAERRESLLVHRFKEALEKEGHIVERLKITPSGEAKPIFTDLYVKNLGLLVEAKGSTDRIAIRMAIGQLTDYRRFVGPEVRCALLVPTLPREDLLQLLAYAGVSVYYPKDSREFAVAPAT